MRKGVKWDGDIFDNDDPAASSLLLCEVSNSWQLTAASSIASDFLATIVEEGGVFNWRDLLGSSSWLDDCCYNRGYTSDPADVEDIEKGGELIFEVEVLW